MGPVNDTEQQRLERQVSAADRGELVSPAPASGAADPASPGAASAPGQAPIVDEAPLWIEAAEQYGAILAEMVPARARAHWTPARLRNVGTALARCAKHYGWKYGAWATHPVAGLALAAVPLTWPIAEPFVAPWLKSITSPAAAGVALPGGETGSPQPASPERLRETPGSSGPVRVPPL